MTRYLAELFVYLFVWCFFKNLSSVPEKELLAEVDSEFIVKLYRTFQVQTVLGNLTPLFKFAKQDKSGNSKLGPWKIGCLKLVPLTHFAGAQLANLENLCLTFTGFL